MSLKGRATFPPAPSQISSQINSAASSRQGSRRGTSTHGQNLAVTGVMCAADSLNSANRKGGHCQNVALPVFYVPYPGRAMFPPAPSQISSQINSAASSRQGSRRGTFIFFFLITFTTRAE